MYAGARAYLEITPNGHFVAHERWSEADPSLSWVSRDLTEQACPTEEQQQQQISTEDAVACSAAAEAAAGYVSPSSGSALPRDYKVL